MAIRLTLLVKSVFGCSPLPNSTATIEPKPRTSPISGALRLVRKSFSWLPKACERASRFSSAMMSSTAKPAAMPRGLPAYVPPNPPGRGASIISALPATPLNTMPPASDLAMVIKSGSTP